MPGKPWTSQEEAELKTFLEENMNVDAIAVRLNKTAKAVITKCKRLGVGLQTEGYVSTKIAIPKELPSVEEALRMLAGALKASIKPGLNRLDVQRLQVVANIAQTYKELAADYAHYREVERKLIQMEEENAQLRRTLQEIKARSSSVSPQQVSS